MKSKIHEHNSVYRNVVSKKYLLLVSAIVIGCFAAKAQLTYQQVSSSGLTGCTFEIGNSEIEVGDVDGDGDLDIVSIGDHGSPNFSATEAGIMVWKNNGTGTSWTYSKSGAFGYGGVALGDVNNDGKMDIGYAMHHNYSGVDFGDQLIEVATGNGTGSSWTPYDDGLATNGETYGMFGIDFADVNNDGLLDLAANSFGCCAGIHIYKNNNNGTWTQTDGATGGNSMKWAQFGDFNNDGNVDLATASELGLIWGNNGTGFFTSMETGMTPDWFGFFDIADVNNDGGKDFGIIGGNGDALVYYYDKAQSKWISISTGLPTSGCIGIALDDMDMDGHADAVIWKPSLVEIYKGDGYGNWSLAGSITIPETQLANMTTGDLDHDGYSDIIYLAKTSQMNSDNMLRVYLHNATTHGMNLMPVNPKGYECFAPGSVQFVNWLASVPSGPAATVTIELSSNGSSGPWTTVVSSAPNSGTYQWTVPSSVNSANCYLKYTITSGTNVQTVTMSNAFGIGTCSTPPTSVEDNETEAFGFSVYPNPMSSQGYAHFSLEKQTDVKIQIVDVLGKNIFTITDETLSTGFYNPRIPVGQLESGIYFCRMIAGDVILNEKIVVTK